MANSSDRWKEYWTRRPASVGELEFLKQVDRTINGREVDNEQIDLIVEMIGDKLGIGRNDHVIDLCCGNGFLTRRVAARAHSVLGIDFSAYLISVAEKHNRPNNVAYLCQSVLDLSGDVLESLSRYGKAYSYDAMQYFSVTESRTFLTLLASISSRGFTLLLCGLPDHQRLFNFYDTPDRRRDYERRLANGTEAIGTWWSASELAALGHETGFDCEILPQDQRLHTAHYRFNARLTRR